MDNIVTPLISAAAALFGVGIGAWVSFRTARDERGQRFVRDQLLEFYAPLSALRVRIRTLSEFRTKVERASDASWHELATSGHVSDADRQRFHSTIDAHNNELRRDLLPMYSRMVDIFTNQYHFAEPSTRAHYATLVEFVESWNRHLDQTIRQKFSPR